MKTIFKSTFAAVTAFATLSHVSAFSSQPNPFGRPQQVSTAPGLVTTSFSHFGRSPTRGIGSFQSLSMSASIQESFSAYPEGMSPKEERDFLRKIAEEKFAGDKDAPDLDKLMEMIEASQNKPDVAVPEDFEIGIESIPCDVEIAIDVVALSLSVIGLKGGSSKKVAKKMYKNLPAKSKKKIVKRVGEMTASNFGDVAWDIINEIYNALTWNALKDSFSSLGWWDAALFAVSFIGIFATGGAAFLINIALLAADFTFLVIAISKCDRF